MKLPGCVRVQGTGRVKLEGVYEQMEKPSEGMPCYMMSGNSQPVYLYWLKGKWKLGCILGSHKCFAVTDRHNSGVTNPCDRSWMWKLYDKETGDYTAAPSTFQVVRAVKPRKKRKFTHGEEEESGSNPAQDVPNTEAGTSDGQEERHESGFTSQQKTFESKLRLMLDNAWSLQEQQRKLDMVAKKLLSTAIDRPGLTNELALQVLAKVRKERETSEMSQSEAQPEAVIKSSLGKDTPSPKAPKGLPPVSTPSPVSPLP